MKVLFYRSGSGRVPVQDFIETLSFEDKALFTEVKMGIESYGLSYPRAAFRQLKGKLWEIRFSAPGGKYRVAYVLLEAERMVWLPGFRKETQRTPRNDLNLALRRLKEVVQ